MNFVVHSLDRNKGGSAAAVSLRGSIIFLRTHSCISWELLKSETFTMGGPLITVSRERTSAELQCRRARADPS
jgi:hypothetical protein